MLTTAVISIGNSDDKLPQRSWASFVQDVGALANVAAVQVHAVAHSASSSPYQNAVFVLELDEGRLDFLRTKLQVLRGRYQQDSIALTIGETTFVQ